LFIYYQKLIDLKLELTLFMEIIYNIVNSVKKIGIMAKRLFFLLTNCF